MAMFGSKGGDKPKDADKLLGEYNTALLSGVMQEVEKKIRNIKFPEYDDEEVYAKIKSVSGSISELARITEEKNNELQTKFVEYAKLTVVDELIHSLNKLIETNDGAVKKELKKLRSELPKDLSADIQALRNQIKDIKPAEIVDIDTPLNAMRTEILKEVEKMISNISFSSRAGGGAHAISHLKKDVELTNLTNGDVLIYNSTTRKWENGAGGGGGGSVNSVNSGTNINVDNTDAANPIVNFVLGADENFVTDAQVTLINNAVQLDSLTINGGGYINTTIDAPIDTIYLDLIEDSIDITRLTPSIETSLGLADTAVQPGALASYVPYTGATSDVDLSGFDLYADNIGIGTTTPAYPLQVAGNGLVSQIGSDPGVVAIGTPNTTGAFVGGYYTAGGGASTIYFGQNGYFDSGWQQPNAAAKSAFYLMQGGTSLWYEKAAGAGTGTPGQNIMSVDKTTGLKVLNTLGLTITGINTFENYALLQLNNTQVGGHNYWFYSGANAAGDFGIYDNTAAAYRLSITATGNIGIGTTSPSSILTIEGVTEQIRAQYNSTNYMTTTISSTGNATFNLVGTAPEFTFSDAVNVPDEAYGAGWNGSLEVPTKNAVYDKVEALPQVTFSTIAVSGQSNVVADTATDTLTLVAGTNITITTDAGTDAITINASGGGSGTSVSKAITQASHGFTVGKIVYLNGAVYTLADKDAAATAEVVGIVTAVAGVNDFTITTNGYVTGLSGLTAGVVYFLGDNGDLTATEPTAIGDISKPLLTADSTTSGYFNNMRGMEISDVGTGGSVNSVTGQVDFGFASGNEGDIATVTVVATWADSANPIICSPIATATADHDPEDYALEAITAYAANIVNGVGFDIIARAPFGTWGRYNVNAIGA